MHIPTYTPPPVRGTIPPWGEGGERKSIEKIETEKNRER